MKNVINIKIFLILILLITLFSVFTNYYTYAADDIIKPENYKPIGDSDKEDKKLTEIGNKIIGPIQVVGSLVSVIAIIIIGIKYMLGSIEEKAQYKEILGPYFLGAIMVFGITNLLSIVYNIATQI